MTVTSVRLIDVASKFQERRCGQYPVRNVVSVSSDEEIIHENIDGLREAIALDVLHKRPSAFQRYQVRNG